MILEDTPSNPIRESVGTLDAIGHPRRRLLLRVLRERRSLTLGELAAAVAEREPPAGADADARRRVLIDLYHCQLPRLADAGLVSYDPDRPVVGITGRGEGADALARRAVGSREPAGSR